ncbi:ExeA family protein [Pararhodospirillum oryzae]|uniref:AAA+ ATPase domain-containing protein n=1 Tax=Pararhodospirillum oryzae TaxID=478448 RepID=A0A512H3U8_9PROT|nr:AAA family ATPase [Pararhodospirillum oryzae]GEO80135.1 hypothetical protein ROR02_02660 [Pararhodospirillum oryzae]
MYENFYSLNRKPFSLLPDAEFLFPSRKHKQAINLLDYGLMSQAGFIVISGDVGSGKTTLIRRYLKQDHPDVTVGLITNSGSTYGHLMMWVATALDVNHHGLDPVQLHEKLLEFLLDQYAKGKRTVLIVDEAQNLTVENLEHLRMMSNINNETDLIIQIILLGQPELLENLKKPELRQFVQRISVHYHLTPLSAIETALYIRHRLTIAGSSSEIFTHSGCAAVHYFTNGVPRLINLLCDVALVYGFSEDFSKIEAPTIIDVVLDRTETGLSPFTAIPPEWDRSRLETEILARYPSPEEIPAPSFPVAPAVVPAASGSPPAPEETPAPKETPASEAPSKPHPDVPLPAPEGEDRPLAPCQDEEPTHHGGTVVVATPPRRRRVLAGLWQGITGRQRR